MTDQKRPEDAVPEAGPSAEPVDGSEPTGGVAEPSRPTASRTEARTAASSKPFATGTTAAEVTGSAGPEGLEQPRYVDDPVSKWWVGIIIAVFGLIFAWALLLGSGGMFSGLLDGDEPTIAPSPGPITSASPSVSPSASPSAATTPAAMVEITPLPIPEPTTAATPSATSAPMAVPTSGPTAGPAG